MHLDVAHISEDHRSSLGLPLSGSSRGSSV